MADYPAAWLRRASQGVEDGTNARTAVANAIAFAAANQAASDPALVDRAVHAYAAKSVRKQRNVEAVAEYAVSALAEPPTADEPLHSPEIDDDWMNIFERYAEDASSERMQLLWGRVLAGQIRKPTSFSLATMRFLSEADQTTVQLAQEISALIVGNFIFKTNDMDKGELLGRLLNAQEIGLISGVGGNLAWQAKTHDGWFSVRGRSHSMRVEGATDMVVPINIINVTRIGQEIARLTPVVSDEQILQGLADRIKGTAGLTEIQVGRNLTADTMDGVVYWAKAAEE